MSEERRNALKIIGAVGTTCAFPFAADELYGQQDHSAHPAPGKQAPAEPAKYFKPAEMKLIGVVADLIIPATDTPSASGAGVPSYIDKVVAENMTLQRNFREGFAWMAQQAKGKAFVDLTKAQQLALLMPLSNAVDAEKINTPSERWFRSMKSLTADGYYTSRVGMVDELGYKGGSVLAEYPECIHEH